MSENTTAPTKDSLSRLVLEAISGTVCQDLLRILSAGSVRSKLAQNYFIFRAANGSIPSVEERTPLAEILKSYHEMDLESVELFLLEGYRHALLSSIGVFDSHISGLLRYIFHHEPALIPPKPLPKPGQSQTEHIEQILTKSHLSRWRDRNTFIVDNFPVQMEAGLIDRLGAAIDLRNKIAHQGSERYTFARDEGDGQVVPSPKVVREVTFEEAQEAHFLVAEVCDAYLVAVCRKYFQEEPRVRVLSAEVAEVHQTLRTEWALKQAELPVIDEFHNPCWTATEDKGKWRVRDLFGHFLVTPIDIGGRVVMFSFLKKTLHGTTPFGVIDEFPKFEMSSLFYQQDFLDQLLSGERILIQYSEHPWNKPKYSRYSLVGFKEAWERAVKNQRTSNVISDQDKG